MRISRSVLASMTQRLNSHLGRPTQAWASDPQTGHLLRSNDGHLHLHVCSPGEGWTRYQLAEISGENGGVNTLSPVCTGQEMYSYLRGVWDVLEQRLEKHPDSRVESGLESALCAVTKGVR